MVTPRRGLLFHFTHISNLAAIARNGLFCDSAAECSQHLVTDVGMPGIKAGRRHREVPIPPGGVVADYVPFYFASRSPMLGSIHMGRVPTYDGGQINVVYLVTSISRVVDSNLPFLFTDRNAAKAFTTFSDDLSLLDETIDWSLMNQMMWNDTADEPDRMERRMAEFLVHRHVPWEAIIGVAAIDDERCQQATDMLTSVGCTTTVRTRREWYF